MAEGLFQVEAGENRKKNKKKPVFDEGEIESISSWLLYKSICLLYSMHRLCRGLFIWSPPVFLYWLILSWKTLVVCAYLSPYFFCVTHNSNDFVSSNWGCACVFLFFPLCFVCVFADKCWALDALEPYTYGIRWQVDVERSKWMGGAFAGYVFDEYQHINIRSSDRSGRLYGK